MDILKRIAIAEMLFVGAFAFLSVGFDSSGGSAMAKSGAPFRLGEQNKLSGKIVETDGLGNKVSSSRLTSGVDMQDRVKEKLEDKAEAVSTVQAIDDAEELLKAQQLIEGAIHSVKKKKSIVTQ